MEKQTIQAFAVFAPFAVKITTATPFFGGRGALSLGGEGLMVNISYYGSRHYMNNVVYGVRQGAIDKLSADMAHELAPFNVCSLSLYPGVVRTEGMVAAASFDPSIDLSGSESPLFVGRCVGALCWERDRSAYNGTTLYTADLGRLYGIEEENGFRPERSEGERR